MSVVKGMVLGFVLALIIAGIQTAVLFGNSVKGEMEGKSQICITGDLCTFSQSTSGYVQLFFLLVFVFGIPASLLGAFIGWLLEKTRIDS